MLHRTRVLALVILAAVTLAATPPTPAFTAPSDVVYITNSGDKYHRENCRHLKSKIKTTREDAQKAGKTACAVCKP